MAGAVIRFIESFIRSNTASYGEHGLAIARGFRLPAGADPVADPATVGVFICSEYELTMVSWSLHVSGADARTGRNPVYSPGVAYYRGVPTVGAYTPTGMRSQTGALADYQLVLCDYDQRFPVDAAGQELWVRYAYHANGRYEVRYYPVPDDTADPAGNAIPVVTQRHTNTDTSEEQYAVTWRPEWLASQTDGTVDLQLAVRPYVYGGPPIEEATVTIGPTSDVSGAPPVGWDTFDPAQAFPGHTAFAVVDPLVLAPDDHHPVSTSAPGIDWRQMPLLFTV